MVHHVQTYLYGTKSFIVYKNPRYTVNGHEVVTIWLYNILSSKFLANEKKLPNGRDIWYVTKSLVFKFAVIGTLLAGKYTALWKIQHLLSNRRPRYSCSHTTVTNERHLLKVGSFRWVASKFNAYNSDGPFIEARQIRAWVSSSSAGPLNQQLWKQTRAATRLEIVVGPPAGWWQSTTKRNYGNEISE